MAPRNKTNSLKQLDQLFLQILGALIDDVVKTSSASAGKVLNLSGDFLSEKAQRAVTQFRDLYFGSAAVEQSKNDMNADVDRLFEQIQGEIAKGSDDTTLSNAVVEKADLKETRLRLSGVQKELETLIRLDQGIREKLVPVLTCMQFEDMMRQRLEHVMIAWKAIVEGLGPDQIIDVELSALEIEANLTSVDERAHFYRLVLKKEPPEGGMDAGILLFDLAS